MSGKHWIKTTFMFIILIISILQTLLVYNKYLGTNKSEEYIYFKRDWIRSHISKKDTKKNNILVFGDSTTASAFLPNIFDKKAMDTNTVNLSIVSSDAQRHLYFLKDFIKYNYVPDIIIWNPTFSRDLKYYLNAGKEETIDYFKMTNNIQFILDYYLPCLNKEKVTNVLLSIFKNRQEIDNVIKDLIKEKGTYYWNGNKYQTLGKDYKDNGYNPNKYPKLVDTTIEYKNHLFNFLNFTKKLNIKVFIIAPPIVIGASLPLNKQPSIYDEIALKYNNVYISDILTSTYYPSELFFDRGHMNYIGAQQYTKDIYNSFNRENIK